ncbi:hypothetical protein [Tellurirhabdus bombi]|uniref:hypothetical protein n=1 Tax=Tellurirhabdus bombi TaxID=2907205 RepID=UPI001F328EA3|nr:hypothetical protein [Tellurirhabdus bombi]
MRNRPSSNQLSRYLNVLMGLVYMGGGIYLIASSQSFGILPTGVGRYIMAVLLIAYGAFRTYRGFQRF